MLQARLWPNSVVFNVKCFLLSIIQHLVTLEELYCWAEQVRVQSFKNHTLKEVYHIRPVFTHEFVVCRAKSAVEMVKGLRRVWKRKCESLKHVLFHKIFIHFL